MKKRLAVSMVLLLGLFGCASNVNTTIPLSGIDKDGNQVTSTVEISLDRYGAYAATRKFETDVQIKALDVESKVAEAEIAKAEAQKQAAVNRFETITAKTEGEIKELKELRMVEALNNAIEKLGDTNIALANKDKKALRDIKFATTKAPKGVFAESVDSLGDGLTKVAQTPAALGASISAGIAAGIRESKKGDDQGIEISTGDGSDVSLADVNNNKSVSTPGTGSLVQQEMGTSKDVENAGEGSATGADGVDAQQPSTTTTETHDTDTSSNIL